MKTALMIYAIALTAIVAFAFTTRDPQSGEATSEFIIIRYYAYTTGGKTDITISYGGGKTEEIALTKEEEKSGITNSIVDVFARFHKQGYELVSTNSPGTGGQVHAYLEKKR